MWYWLWKKWHWDRFCYSEYLGAPLSVSFHQCSILIFMHMLFLVVGLIDETCGISKSSVLSAVMKMEGTFTGSAVARRCWLGCLRRGADGGGGHPPTESLFTYTLQVMYRFWLPLWYSETNGESNSEAGVFRGLNDSNVRKLDSVKKELAGLQIENFSRDHFKTLNRWSSTERS